MQIDNVRYVPDLSESIYSLFLHVRTPHHGLQSSFETGLYINFPDFQTKAIISSDDIYLDALPARVDLSDHQSESSFGLASDSPTCKHITQLSDPITIESKKDNNLLINLRQYYDEVKTKRQLNLEIPAGFRHQNTLQRQIRDLQLSNEPSSLLDPPNPENRISPVELDQPTDNDTAVIEPTSLPNESSKVSVPIL
jgi:hypothetical protein